MGRYFRVIALLTAALGSATLSRAQEVQNLQIVIRTGEKLKKKDVEQSFKDALKVIGRKPNGHGDNIIDGKLIVRDITAVDYNAYRRLEDPEAILAPLPSQKKDDLEVRQLPAATPTWEFNLLGNTPKELSKLEVTFDDEAEKPVALEPTKKRSDPLTLTQFGSYVLTPPKDKKPVKFKATIREVGTDKETIAEGEWPKSDNFYLIRMNGYKGTKKELSDTIRDTSDAGIGGNALDAFVIKSDVTLAIGEADATDDEVGEFKFDGNKLHISVPPNRRQNAARVYFRFPLTEKEMIAELKDLNSPKRNQTELAEYIRAQKPVPANQDYVITADTKAAWLELPKILEPNNGLRVGSYGRTVSIANSNAKLVKPEDYAKVQTTFPETYQITVYEFDNGSVINVIPYKRTPDQKERTKANGGPLSNWSLELAARVKAPGDAPKEDKPKDK